MKNIFYIAKNYKITIKLSILIFNKYIFLCDYLYDYILKNIFYK